MMRIVQIVLGLVVVLVLSLTAVVLLVSPNQFKPVLKDLAAKQGIALEIGNMGWTFWPRLGVSLADVSVAPLTSPDAPLASFSDAGLLLAVKPLLRGEFEVDYVRLGNAQVQLIQDAKGVGNWEFLLSDETAVSPSPATNPEAPADAKPMVLAIERVALTNARVQFTNLQQGSDIEISDINFDAQDLNISERAFPLQLAFAVRLKTDAGEQRVQASLSQQLSVSGDFARVNITDGRANLSFSDQAVADAALTYQVALKDATGALNYQGELAFDKLNVRHWLKALGIEMDMADAKALNAVALRTHFAGNTQQIALDNFILRLDDSELKGAINIKDFTRLTLVADLALDAINLDNYLPPPAPETAPVDAVPAADTPLPLASLRELNLDAKFTVGQLQAKKFTLTDLTLALRLQQGKFTQTLNANTYEGAIAQTAEGSIGSTSAQALLKATLDSVQIAPIMAAQALDKNVTLSGAVNADVTAALKGASVNQLIESVDMRASFNGAAVRLAPLNIEQRVCQAIGLITENKAHEIKWDEFTEMRELKGEIVLKDQIINLSNVNAGVSQLMVSGLGTVDLARGKFNIGLPVSILSASDAAASSHCRLTTEMEWLNRSLTLLRCRGDLADMNLVKDCGPDKEALVSLTADYAKYKLREKHGDKIDAAEQKVADEKQKLTNKVSEKLGVAEGEDLNVQSALGGLLRKKLGASSAAASAMSSSSHASSAPAETVTE